MSEVFGTKICCGCNILKTIDLFGKKRSQKDGLQPRCKECRKFSTKKYYIGHEEQQKNRVKKYNSLNRIKVHEYIFDYLSKHPCTICNENDILVLEFDHVVNKTENISVLIKNRSSITKIQEEINKCQVLCANCHKRKTAKDQKWYKFWRGETVFNRVS